MSQAPHPAAAKVRQREPRDELWQQHGIIAIARYATPLRDPARLPRSP